MTKWERVRRANHWFDALYNACAAGYFCRVRLIGTAPAPRRYSLSEQQQQRRNGKLSRLQQ